MAGWNIGSFGLAPKSWNKAGNEFFFGSDSRMDPYNKQSLNFLQQLMQNGGLEDNSLYQSGQSYLQKLLSGDPSAFAEFEAPYKQQFEQETIPGIAERFAGMGTGSGASSSSGLYNSLARASKEFSTNLAGMRSGMQMQAAQQGLQYAQQPINNRYNAATAIPNQYYETPGQPGLVQGAANSFAQGAGRGFARGGF